MDKFVLANIIHNEMSKVWDFNRSIDVVYVHNNNQETSKIQNLNLALTTLAFPCAFRGLDMPLTLVAYYEGKDWSYTLQTNIDPFNMFYIFTHVFLRKLSFRSPSIRFKSNTLNFGVPIIDHKKMNVHLSDSSSNHYFFLSFS